MSRDQQVDFELFSDEPLQGDFEFGAEHLIDTVRYIVTTCPTPYHIGLFAPWGAGKSTILEALAGKHAQRMSRVRVVYLNAWKYRHDSLRRKFLLTAAKELDPEQGSSLRKRMYTVLTGLSDPKDWDWKLLKSHQWRERFYQRMRTPLNVSLLALLFVVLIGLVQAVAELHGNILGVVGAWTWFGKAAGLLGTPLVVFLVSTMVTALGKIQVDNGGNEQLTNQEQFEDQFLDSLKVLGELDRVLIVVDELDRCAPEQVLEALETVKTFMNAPQCVFVIACDREIIESALEKTLQPNGGRAKAYLDKIFQLTMQLPPVQPSDMYSYADKLLKTNVSQVSANFAAQIVDSRALEVLIRPDVTTPRKVKRLLNDFLVRYSLAVRREAGWDDAGLTQDLPFLAKMTVLASDFPDFYDNLVANSELMSWLDKIRLGQVESLEPYQKDVCKRYYITDKGSTDWERPAPPHAKLLRFLGQTWQFQGSGEKVRKHLHLARDPEGVLIGDSYLAEISASAEAAHFKILERQVAALRDTDPALHFLSSRIKIARGTVQTNLLLSLLQLSTYAHLDQPGTHAAAGVLGMYSDVLTGEDIWNDVTPIRVMAYLPVMPTMAAEAWLRRVTGWVRESLEDRGKEYFAADNLSNLASLPPSSFALNTALLWEWLQTPGGQQDLPASLKALSSAPSVRSWLVDMFPQFTKWVWGEKDEGKTKRVKLTKAQEAIVKDWVQTIGPSELMKVGPDKFWSTMDALLWPYPSVGREWVLPVVLELKDEIPEEWAAKILYDAVYSQDNTSGHDLWHGVLTFAQHILGKYGRGAIDKGDDLVAVLTDGFDEAGIGPIASVIIEFWNLWQEEQRFQFHSSLVSAIADDSAEQRLLDATEALSKTSESVRDKERAGYYTALSGVIEAQWHDDEIMGRVTSVLGVQRPFAIPSSSKGVLSSTLASVTFPDRDPRRTFPLQCLSELYADLVPGDEGTFVQHVINMFITGETDIKRFKSGCHAATRYAARLGKWPGIAQSLFDALMLHAQDKQRGSYGRSAIHCLLRSIPANALPSRQNEISTFLTDLSELDDALLTMSALADHGEPLDFVALSLDWANVLHDEECGPLVQWVLRHPSETPVRALAERAVDYDHVNGFFNRLAAEGGMDTREAIVVALCSNIKTNTRTPESAFGILESVAPAKDNRISRHTTDLTVHFLTGDQNKQDRILIHLDQIASARFISTGDQKKIREHLLACYVKGDDSRKIAVAKALRNAGLTNAQARATIESTPPTSESTRAEIKEIILKRS